MSNQPKRAAKPRSLMTRLRAAHSRTHLIVMLAVGLVGAGVSGLFGLWTYAALIGWDAAAAIFCTWVWVAVGGMSPDETDAYAGREDPGRTATEALMLLATVASLVAVGVVLVSASGAHGAKEGLLAGLAVGSVALGWLLIHTLFTLRYARLYHLGGKGIDFNQDDPPRYVDFAYVAFTIGMTFQVSDTDLQTGAIRSSALRHALLSYLFGAIILATTVNFIVTLSTSSG